MRFRLARALAASLLLHGIVVALLLLVPGPARVSPATPARTRVDVDVLWSSQAEARGEESVTPKGAATGGVASVTGRRLVIQAERASAEKEPSSGSHAATPGAGSSTQRQQVATGLRFPRLGWEAIGGDAGPADWGGHTVRNEPGQTPDGRAVAEEEARQAAERIQAWVQEEQASLRVDTGVVDEHFRRMGEAMARAVAHPPVWDRASFARDFLAPMARAGRVWLSDELPRYGATGSPVAPGGQGGAPFAVTAGKVTEYTQGAPSGVVALVEIAQAANGRVRTVLLVKSSGNAVFDAHVLATAPRSAEELVPPRDRPGVHEDGTTRSLWSFEGRVVWGKKLRDFELGKDWAYLAAVSIPHLLAGLRFDETMGDIWVVDARDPQFVCRVQLVKLY